jgi:hypothetical protein
VSASPNPLAPGIMPRFMSSMLYSAGYTVKQRAQRELGPAAARSRGAGGGTGQAALIDGGSIGHSYERARRGGWLAV